MPTSYKVRIWKTEIYAGSRKTTHYVRWSIDRKPFKVPFDTGLLAESFRSDLVSAARRGEAFDTESGLPVSMTRTDRTMPWFTFAVKFVDMKWPDASPGHRRNIVDGLIPITLALLPATKSRPSDSALRAAIRQGLNPNTRMEGDTVLEWVDRNAPPVGDLAKPEVLRRVLAAADLTISGTRAAPDTVRLRRTTLGSALMYAVEEEKLLQTNPLKEVLVRRHKTTLREVDRRCVISPIQARTIFEAVKGIGERGRRLVAFFALMYYAALRPEEAANIRRANLVLPTEGWGEIHLGGAAPEAAPQWTDSGVRNEERGLKHRQDGVGRTVPCPPELTALLRWHLETYGTASDGRLFRGARNGGRIGSTTYGRLWAQARALVFTPDVLAGPLARRPYDLRHAAVSTWLNGGVEPPRVADWAGHSLAVLLRVYAKCIDGGEQAARAKVQLALTGR